MKSFPEILKEKRDYYGNTEAAIVFAAEEWLVQLLPTIKEIEEQFSVTSHHQMDTDSWNNRLRQKGAEWVIEQINKKLD